MVRYGPRRVDSIILKLPTFDRKSPTGWYGFDRKLAPWESESVSITAASDGLDGLVVVTISDKQSHRRQERNIPRCLPQHHLCHWHHSQH